MTAPRARIEELVALLCTKLSKEETIPLVE